VLESVEIENLRCIRQGRLDFDDIATAVVGENGSGKTSLLEAIFFLSAGRSFRTNAREYLLAQGADFFRVVGRIRTDLGSMVLGAEWREGSSRLRLAGRPVGSSSEMAAALPLQVIEPGVHRVIEEGSSRRRRLLDWGVFHVKHEFMPAWRRYQRALEQRNAALKSGAGIQGASIWDAELASAGTCVSRSRADYLERLAPHFRELCAELLTDSVTLEYRQGWAAGEPLDEALRTARERDAKVRFTTVGAHRADLRLKLAGFTARDRVSRGEQKMLAIALILAQVRCLAELGGPRSTLLLDDPAAELDVDNLGKVLRTLRSLPCQLVVTAVNPESLSGLPFGRMFHVKQGAFRPMV
jgi:DNA replication and repair protein RecF